MNTIKIANNAYWIGKIDDRKVPFHRLILEREVPHITVTF
jgi:hypothetical protein